MNDNDGGRSAGNGSEPLTDFGYQRVPVGDKKRRVRAVFDSVAPRYDLMNDAMSLGLHRLWKRFTAAKTGLKPGQRALDVAAGSADLSIPMARQVGPTGHIFVTDINYDMLSVGRDRMLDAGCAGNVSYLLADAEALPLADKSVHCVTIGFGLRNVTDKDAALRSMYRVLKPGGRLLVLEFSQPKLGPLNAIYDAYSFQVLPRMGRLLADDDASYRYLAESIRKHPDQQSLVQMFEAAGFERCEYFNLSGGIVALHVGFRL
ncbi:MAG: bifunctional demethylmenaquinone methyltransferase/2-methoxy-6-polyprenyl-1,4-benzoquinol methylase UbiE [Gammaproteobacteria bacterium]|nr:bifunctional demethylmenaquinone methyltransferase/2-methoxy-6-polyprenyl-1,4-benzoquinol methylase UbiE [Gammaproteobacteria bacterium]